MSRQIFSKDELTQEELRAAKDSYNAKAKTTKGRKDVAGNSIEFRLTFEEWLTVWLKSGKVLQRGVRHGQYCMSRRDDLGHYEPENVFIQLSSENAKQGRAAVKHSDETRAKMSVQRRGRPNGKKGSRHNRNVQRTSDSNSNVFHHQGAGQSVQVGE